MSDAIAVVPVILAGGSGTRLWPVSRKSYPKQFSAIGSDKSLFQETALRLSGASMARPVVLTSEDYRFIVTEQLGGVGILPDTVFIEPDGRNTAPAVLIAALALEKTNPDALMLVAPSDHAIPDTSAFRATINAAIPSAVAGAIVTFGITPDRPETGYGYLELGSAALGADPEKLTRFVEKPNLETAQKMLDSGNFLWNAGIFLFGVKRILEAYKTLKPEMVTAASAALAQSAPDLGFQRLDKEAWSNIENVSIDYAIMEHDSNLMVMPFSAGWSDLGDWEAVRRMSADPDGNAQHGQVTAIDCADSLLWSSNDTQQVVGIGLDNIIAVALPDAVLVADRSRAQDVKNAVDALKAKSAKQATEFTRDHRPWGWFDSLAMGPRFQVKRIVVKPGAKLSLQSHVHRAEHWIVVEGTAHVTIDDDVKIVTENQSVYIPLGSVHRMENRGKVNMTLIEVQTGIYLGEDDIIRYEDSYART